MFIALTAFLISFLLLAKPGTLLVRSATYLARFFHLSEYSIAFIFMSIGTSMPEFFVGISSAISGTSALSLGNIMGANFINMTLVLAATALIAGEVTIDGALSKQNFWLVAVLAFLPPLLAYDGIISRGDGVVLLASFGIYMWKVVGEKEYFTKTLNNITTEKNFAQNALASLSKFFIAISLLLLSSALVVWSGTALARDLSFNLLSFGVLFVAIGTTLPEIALGIRAAMLGHASMSMGNILGSVSFNAAFITGAVSIIRPIPVAAGAHLALISAALLAAFILFNIFIYVNSSVSRKEAWWLVGLYAAFFATEMFYLN
ncbi:MAG: sodium:calcium antiporter [Candidatus Niyogibacteria bacterium]|nr:sodium:calcium antiporter [Candidatus Niyogibacteria bacterium]